MIKLLFSVTCAMLAWGYCTRPAHAETYRFADDFSLPGKTQTAWRYGFAPNLEKGYPFYVFADGASDLFGNAPGILGFANAARTPWQNAFKNTSAAAVAVGPNPKWILQPGQAGLHPNNGTERAVTRWLAPAEGQVKIQGRFYWMDSATTDVHVLHNGESLFESTIDAANPERTFAQTFPVKQGDSIDFAVGSQGSNEKDPTGLEATIELEKADKNASKLDGDQLLSRFAPADLARVLKKEPPFALGVGGIPLDVELTESEPGILRGQNGNLQIVVNYRYNEALRGLSYQVELRNSGDAPLEKVTIQPLRLRFDADAATDQPRVRHYDGSKTADATYPPRSFREYQERFATFMFCQPLKIGSAEGASASVHAPVLQFAVGPEGKWSGLFTGFEWSGRWNIDATWDAALSWEPDAFPVRRKVYGHTFLINGNMGFAEMRIEPGEVIAIPRVHLGFWEGKDWNAGDSAVRRYVHDAIIPKLDGKPTEGAVSYNHYFGLDIRWNAEVIKQQMDKAAEIGCEYFTLDATWYKTAPTFVEGMGNWFSPDPTRLPNGLEEVSAYAEKKGLKFGLWHAFQIAKPGSDMLVRYPELFDNQNLVPAKLNPGEVAKGDYLRLDLPEARKAAIDLLSGLSKKHHLKWMRWEFQHPEDWLYKLDPSGKLALRYWNGLYEVVDTVLAENPGMIAECCMGGGQKMDWGMAAHTHNAWISDHMYDTDVCRFMQTGASRFWPGSYLNMAVTRWIGAEEPPPSTYELLSRMVGAPMMSGQISKWNAEETAFVKKHLDVYKEIRHLLNGTVDFPLRQPKNDRDWDVVIHGDLGAEQVLYAFRMNGADEMFIATPGGKEPWKQLLASPGTKLQSDANGVKIRLPRNGACLLRRR